jgi:hypothetical protein
VSDPIRYRLDVQGKNYLVAMVADRDGEYVDYRNYAALQAEKEVETRATFDAIRTITQLRDDYAALQAENERLRKAGDGLMFEGETMAHEVSWNPAPWDRVVAAWVAAKEGGRK